jgi:hypothetical protein
MDNKKKNYPMIGRYNPINPISFDSNYSYIDVKPCISYYYPFVKVILELFLAAGSS